MRDIWWSLDNERSVKLSDLEAIANDLRAQLAAVGKRVDDLKAHVEAAKREPDGFAAFLYAARRSYSHASATDGKGGKKVEREARRSYVQAQDYGFKGPIREWEELLRLRTQPEKRRGF
jgi:hypothetical protein